MVLFLVRFIYLLVVLAITVSFAFQEDIYGQGANYVTWFILIPVGAALALVLGDSFWEKKRLQVLSGLFFGLLAGLVIAFVMAQIAEFTGRVFVSPEHYDMRSKKGRSAQRVLVNVYVTSQPAAEGAGAGQATPPAAHVEAPPPTEDEQAGLGENPLIVMIKMLLGASVVFICVSFVLQTKDDFRFVIPYVEFARQTKGSRPILLDTSVIIDGRISDIADTRILESQIVVPRFVLQELQTIADSDDKLKRNRGRRGLDILNRLRENKKLDLQILDVHVPQVDEVPEVDSKLVALAKHLDGRVVTNDYNLNKISRLRGVDVININDLANALKPVVLPGETLKVKILKPGEEAGQGVGYLEDGTMVVAEQGRDHIGREITITVTSVLQTSAGRMIFGRLDANKTFSSRDQRT